MKPGDHPEFYRLPPPKGRSRESSIVLDEHGRFFHDGREIENEKMKRTFLRWLDKHPENGRPILQNGYDWTYLDVVDAPLLVLSISNRAPEPPLLSLNDGSQEELDPHTLRMGKNDALYCEARGGKLTARFSPQAQNLLAPYLVELASGEVGFAYRGEVVPLSGA